jgi:hypothetical protein
VNRTWPAAGFAMNLIASLVAFAASVLFVPWLIRKLGRQTKIDAARAQLGQDIVADIDRVLIRVIQGLYEMLEPDPELIGLTWISRPDQVPEAITDLADRFKNAEDNGLDPYGCLNIFAGFDGMFAMVEERLRQLTTGSDDTAPYHVASFARSRARKLGESHERLGGYRESYEFLDVMVAVQAVRDELLQFVWAARGIESVPEVYLERGEYTIFAVGCGWRVRTDTSWFRFPEPRFSFVSRSARERLTTWVYDGLSPLVVRRLLCATNERILLLATTRIGSPNWVISHSFGPGDLNRVGYATWRRSYRLTSYGRHQLVKLPIPAKYTRAFEDHLGLLSARTSLVNGTVFPAVETAWSVGRCLWSWKWAASQLARGVTLVATALVASAVIATAVARAGWAFPLFLVVCPLMSAPLVAWSLVSPHFARTTALGRGRAIGRCMLNIDFFAALLIGASVLLSAPSVHVLLEVALRGIGVPSSLAGVRPANLARQCVLIRRFMVAATGVPIIATIAARSATGASATLVGWAILMGCCVTCAGALAVSCVIGWWADQIRLSLPATLAEAGQGPRPPTDLRPEPHAHESPFVLREETFSLQTESRWSRRVARLRR